MTSETRPPLIEVDHVSKEFGSGPQGVRAVKDVSFTVFPGEFVALVGPSGSGKSTLLNLIGTLDRPTEGQIRIDGQDTGALSHARLSELRFRTIGLVFQHFYMLPALSALDNVALPLLSHRVPYNRRARAAERLEWVGLTEKMHKLPSQLSGGEQQRVCIARALVADPRVILADEPTGNLDTENGWQVFQTLLSQARERDVAVVMATHNPAMAARADRVIHIVDGIATAPDRAARDEAQPQSLR